MRVRAIPSSQMPKVARATGQAMASKIPRLVATDLPPLKPSQQERLWPTTAPKAATTTHHGDPKADPSATAAAPLAASTSNTNSAGPLPSVRNTLVAPVEPDPC